MNMEKPVPFLLFNSGGKITVNEDAADVLKDISQELVVISVVGKYRTGKSYLMNRFFATNAGFALGSTVESKTKGIWLWAKPHPRLQGKTLLLLDVEGLYDVEKGDKTHDMKLFSLALLLSSSLINNVQGAIDDNIVQDLSLVTRLTDHIKTDMKEETGDNFKDYFPSLNMVLRDFCLKLEIDGEACTADEYLEHALKVQKGRKQAVIDANEIRDCIKTFFTKRRCFTLCRPVEDAEKLWNLHNLGIEDISPEFLEQSEALVSDILGQCKEFKIEGNTINGRSFLNLAESYTSAFNRGTIPCISSAMNLLKENECRKTCQASLTKFKDVVMGEMKEDFPRESDELQRVRITAEETAINHYNEHSLLDKNGKHLDSLKDKMDEYWKGIVIANNANSTKECEKLVAFCFQHIETCIQNSLYTESGGYKVYLQDKEMALQRYNSTPGKGPMAEDVLTKYLQNRKAGEAIIESVDKAMTLRDQTIAEEREEHKRQAEETRTEMNKQIEMMQNIAEQQKQREQEISKKHKQFKEEQDQIMKRHQEEIEAKNKELQRRKFEAAARKGEIENMANAMRKEREKKEQIHERQIKELQAEHRQQLNDLRLYGIIERKCDPSQFKMTRVQDAESEVKYSNVLDELKKRQSTSYE